MGSYRSKENDVNRISTSIFVTNFPDSFKAKDLFHVCKQYRHVVDSFIPLKRTKEGKRFGFVRFINVFNVERLVSNLCTICVDRLKFHANRARFDRAPLNRANAHVKNIAMPVKFTNHTACMGDRAMGGGKSYVNVVASNARSRYSKDMGQNSYVGTVKKKIEFRQIMEEQHIPSLVLDDTCVLDYDYSLALVGKVSDFESLEKFKSHVGVGSWFISLEYAHNSFSIDERVVWVDIKGVPMNVWTNNMFTKISAKWIIVKGKVFWIRVKEVSGWVLGFLEEDDEVDESEDDTLDNEYGGDMKAADFQEEAEVDDDVNKVPETIFDKTEASKERNVKELEKGGINSKDPFNIYDLLKKKTGGNDKEVMKSKETLEFPPGFTPNMDSEKKGDQDGFLDAEVLILNKQENGYVNCNGESSKRGVSQSPEKAKKDWVKEICNKNKVNFLSLQETKMETIDHFGIKNCWGNYSFEHVCGPSVDNSGGILCVWDSRMFRKHNATILDYFVAIQGEWISNAKKLLIIFVNAPQEISEKRMLWSYLNHMIDSWSGESIIMGDFNEVRSKEERFGTIFNNHNARVFNSFISSSGLLEVPLGGYEFTWCHKSGSKMSKLDRFLISEGLMSSCPNILAVTLDRHLSDHRPILL
nr:RNA-directed DNA polymerase, eukaryota, reverse transcriptase zinc-binding domain protein [Tanacetum cinerariifolium]